VTVTRLDPTNHADERTALREWLEYHRATLLLKCEGLDGAALARRPVPTSMMSLHGLVRHMADVERNWFRRWIEGAPAEPIFYDHDEHPDGDFELADGTTWDADLATWHAEVAHARAVEAAVPSLDQVCRRQDRDVTYDVRWILLHMVEEYARHNGHADLLREMIDGTVGD
jgi:uncharacterized damage-inducible protein DinB